MKIDFIPRILQSTDWATIIFFLTMVLLAVNRNVFTAKFNDYIRLLYSDKYIKIYKEPANMKSWFTISIFVIQMVSLSFVIHIFMSVLGFTHLHSFIDYIQILNLCTFFILFKYLVEKIFSVIMHIEDFVVHYNFLKVSYRGYAALLVLPIAMMMFYSDFYEEMVVYVMAGLAVLINIIFYWVIIKNCRNEISPYLFYFILYLCAFEIAPYFILYKCIEVYNS